MITINNRFTGNVMAEGDTYQECFEKLRDKNGVIRLSGVYLRGADLEGADLQDADLSKASLTGADLTGANLQYADLTGAYLKGADLSKAELRGADLREANLTGAYLKGADLQDTDLSKADLTGADLEGADLDYASWPLWCGSLNVKVDENIKAQILYHAISLLSKEQRSSVNLVELANKFKGIEMYNLPKL